MGGRSTALGRQIEEELSAGDVRLTMGGEPTFVSSTTWTATEWNYAALGAKKRELAGRLLQRLQQRFAPGGLLHFGQGKWYPGEPLPRWALTCLWRTDGQPLWRNATFAGRRRRSYGYRVADAQAFIRVARCAPGTAIANTSLPPYEDVWDVLRTEQNVPVNFDPLQRDSPMPPSARAWRACCKAASCNRRASCCRCNRSRPKAAVQRWEAASGRCGASICI